MNPTIRWLWTLIPSASIPLADAQDRKQQAGDAATAKAGPNVAAMMAMDHSKVDRNDPVRKAMTGKRGNAADHLGMNRGATGKHTGTATQPHDHGSH